MNDELYISVEQRLEQLRADIVSNIESHRITASGRTQRSLKVVVYDGGVKLIAEAGERAPIDSLEVGRPPGNVPGGFRMTKSGVRDVSSTFKAILLRWAADKGIDMTWGGATMLGRRIASEGTRRYSTHEDVYSTLVRQAAEDIKGLVIPKIKQMIKLNY